MYDRCEINLISVLSLASEGKLDNFAEENSQQCESFIRNARSNSPTWSTMINFTIKALSARLLKINYTENVVQKLNHNLNFGQKKSVGESEEFTTFSSREIEECVTTGIQQAEDEARLLGITVIHTQLHKLVKKVKPINVTLDETHSETDSRNIDSTQSNAEQLSSDNSDSENSALENSDLDNSDSENSDTENSDDLDNAREDEYTQYGAWVFTSEGTGT